ncbi:MAG: zinc ABC transporter substrate-binding protein [Mycobacterium sp.]|nr:zinc ABC transporter substrate-binding protein [Mycobacterium sp.]
MPQRSFRDFHVFRLWSALAPCIAVVVAAGVLSHVGWSVAPTAHAAAPLNVVATTTQIEDFVAHVGGERVNVLPILAGDDDPHDYQPTADDARKFAQADLVLANGVGLETWMDPLLTNVPNGTPIVRLGDESDLPLLQGTGEEEQSGDPHVWQDPTNVEKMVVKIRDTLSATDPDGAPTYQANAEVYTAQLDQLDQSISQQIQTIPPDQRKLVTNHDAFTYYVNRYGLTFVGSVIPSLSTDAQPSAAEVQQLVQEIADQHVKAIYTETTVNPQLERQIAQLASVKVYSNLYGDALGKAGTPGETYIGAMQFNTQQIVDGLR